MRSWGVLCFCVLAGGAGVLAALAVAAGPAVGAAGTTTAPATTTTRPATPPPALTPPAPPLIVPDGVTIGGVSVGGFAPADAQQLVRTQFDQLLRIVVGKRTLLVPPGALGAVARVDTSVQRALTAAPGDTVPLAITVKRTVTKRYVRKLARAFDRSATDSDVRLRGRHPFVREAQPGRALSQRWATLALVNALLANTRDPVKLPYRDVQPTVTRENFGPVIVVRRGQHRLWLYRGMRLWRTFGVAVGQPAWPTPLGRFEIVVKWRNPWWFPPNSAWARGSAPEPPGPSNPLGTRWMGISSPGVGIHGTPTPSSIGYSASHGCIRMLIPQAEWLFEHVPVGTPVFIIPA
ncbi:MAG: L,D-transpeptidase family protein [Gaiellaceae bacterium]